MLIIPPFFIISKNFKLKKHHYFVTFYQRACYAGKSLDV